MLEVSREVPRSAFAVYLLRLAPNSRRTMGQSLNVIAGIASAGACDGATFPWGELRYEHTLAIRSELADRCSLATANRHLAALRGVLKESWRLGQMSAETYHAAADVPTLKGSTLPKGRALDPGEIRALFQACKNDSTAAGARDAALLAVLYGGGLRRTEAVGLNWGDYDRQAGELLIRGKGNRQRLMFATAGSQRALYAWASVRNGEPGPLLMPVNRGGRIVRRRLSSQAIRYALEKRGKEAGAGAFSPHDLRRSFISHLLDAGADIATVRELAGHSDVSTTARYDRRGDRTRQQAAELLLVPF